MDHDAVPQGQQRVLARQAPMPVLYAISSWAVRQGLAIHDISVQRPTLEDIYLRLTEEHS